MFSRSIALTFVVACCAQGWANDRPAWVMPEVLNVRKGPGTDTARVGQLRRGDQVTVTAFRPDRWCRVNLPAGGTGWVREEYLEFSRIKAQEELARAGGASAAPAWVQGSVVNLRSGPDIGSGIAVQLKRGEKVHVVGQEGNWRRVKSDGGQFGWIRRDLLEFDPEKGRTLAAGTASTAARAEPPPAWVSVNVANVRSGPSTGYSLAGQFTLGTKVFILERKDGWARCKGPDVTGWIHADLLETNVERGRTLAAGDAGTRDKAYCIGGLVSLRRGPSTDSEKVGDVREGTTLWVQEEKDGWCRVDVEGGSAGWIAGWYVRRHGANTTVTQAPAAPTPAPPAADFPAPTRAASTDTRLQPFRAWIAADNTNVRYGPGVDRDVKFQLGKHSPVEVVETQGQWCRVRTDSGTYGWAAGWVLDFQPPGQPEATKVVEGEPVEAKAGWVNRPRVNVRTAPGTDNTIATRATLGTEVVITEQQDGWLRVALSDGTMGWVAENLIKTRAEHADLQPDGARADDISSRGRAVVREAMRHLGKAYVRGASGPNTFDCSGLTSYVYRQFGINLPRTTGGQYLRGRPVSRDELELGDVVVFKDTYRSGISHVGIYIGQGRFIHASNSRGGVKITDLDSSYYAPRYVGARRMF